LTQQLVVVVRLALEVDADTSLTIDSITPIAAKTTQTSRR